MFPRWGRWKDILNHGRFKKQLTERDVESICRALLSYCLVHYRGDDKIKSFMWDLIAPTEDGRTKELQNHLGESQRFKGCIKYYGITTGEKVFEGIVTFPLQHR